MLECLCSLVGFLMIDKFEIVGKYLFACFRREMSETLSEWVYERITKCVGKIKLWSGASQP